MRIIRAKDYEDMSRKAAGIIAAQVILKPDCVLGLATGSSPVGTYAALAEGYRRGDLDFSGITTVNLDEYKGLSRDNDQSYSYFMNRHFFSKVNIDPARTFLPDGTETDSDKACQEYDRILAGVGPVDLQLLGLGHNEHIGFNEPNTVFEAGTHCVDLASSTVEANKRFFTSIDDVPRQAYTMGIGTIMQARRVLVVVSGRDKAAAVRAAFFGPVTPQVQGSVLQFHNDAVIVADEEALSEVL